MTNVVIHLTQPDPSGNPIDATGHVTFAPSRRTTTPTTVLLPEPFTVVVTSSTTVALQPNDATWLWKVTETTDAGTHTFYTTVPGSGSVQYSQLTLIDPATLTAEPPDQPAWIAQLAGKANLVSGKVPVSELGTGTTGTGDQYRTLRGDQTYGTGVITVPVGTAIPAGVPDGTLFVEYTP